MNKLQRQQLITMVEKQKAVQRKMQPGKQVLNNVSYDQISFCIPFLFRYPGGKPFWGQFAPASTIIGKFRQRLVACGSFSGSNSNHPRTSCVRLPNKIYTTIYIFENIFIKCFESPRAYCGGSSRHQKLQGTNAAVL